jgi:hypothetical protein
MSEDDSRYVVSFYNERGGFAPSPDVVTDYLRDALYIMSNVARWTPQVAYAQVWDNHDGTARVTAYSHAHALRLYEDSIGR